MFNRLVRSLFLATFAALALFLMALNLYGQLYGLRNPALAHEPMFRRDDLLLEPRQFWRLARKGVDEEQAVYVQRVNRAVSESLAHYWANDGIDRYNLRVPPRENYWLYLAARIDPRRFQKYEFHDPEKAVERGVGLCSQHAIVLERVLERNGIPAKTLQLQGHVVTLVGTRTGANSWILDPDYGVALEARLEDIERDPTSIVPAYALANVPPDRLASLVAAYRAPNVEFDSACAYLGWKCRLETISYVAKWIFPVTLLFLAWAWTGLSRRRLRRLSERRSGTGELGLYTCKLQ